MPAFKPSQRRSGEGEVTEPDITPMMNLMVVLIPMLLASAEFVKIGMLEINLPPAAGPGGGGGPSEPQEEVAKLDLSISITKKGFIIASSSGVLPGPSGSEDEPSIPKEGDTYNYQELEKKLLEVKRRAKQAGISSDLSKVMIIAEADIPYQTIVDVMDHSRQTRTEDGQKVKLFPEVSLSSGIQ